MGAISSVGCGETSDQSDEQSTVKPLAISRSNIEMTVGENYKLYLNNASDSVDYVWSSDNQLVASVMGDGVVYALSKGVATITVSADGVELKCSVIVKSKSSGVLSIKLNKVENTVILNSALKITATVYSDSIATSKSVEWEMPSDFKLYADYSINGNELNITTFAEGDFNIRAVCEGVSAVYKLHVVRSIAYAE